MEYIKTCLHCRLTFKSKRKDKIYHDPKCKSRHWRLLRGFKKVADLVPEEEVKKEYYVPKGEACAIYLQWFHSADDPNVRWADVWYSKGCPTKDIEKRWRKNKYPTRHLIIEEEED